MSLKSRKKGTTNPFYVFFFNKEFYLSLQYIRTFNNIENGTNHFLMFKYEAFHTQNFVNYDAKGMIYFKKNFSKMPIWIL